MTHGVPFIGFSTLCKEPPIPLVGKEMQRKSSYGRKAAIFEFFGSCTWSMERFWSIKVGDGWAWCIFSSSLASYPMGYLWLYTLSYLSCPNISSSDVLACIMRRSGELGTPRSRHGFVPYKKFLVFYLYPIYFYCALSTTQLVLL